MSPGSDVVWQRRASVLWRRSGGAALLKAADSAGIVALEGSGLQVWCELEQPATVLVLARRLAEHYGADPAAVATDLAPLLDDLERRGLVRRSPS